MYLVITGQLTLLYSSEVQSDFTEVDGGAGPNAGWGRVVLLQQEKQLSGKSEIQRGWAGRPYLSKHEEINCREQLTWVDGNG